MGSIAGILKADPSKSRLSKNTIERKRKNNRKIIALNIKDDFISKYASEASVIHWDGKLLLDMTRNIGTIKRKVDYIAVTVTSNGISKLLGVPKVDEGTGDKMAEVVFDELSKWKMTKIIGMCTDTTNSNTGWKSGAAAMLQAKYLKTQLLYFTCRHHIFEVILGAIFTLTFGDSKSPNVGIFVEFRKEWNGIKNKDDLEELPNTLFQSPLTKRSKSETIQSLQNILSDETSYVPRDDYRELIHLTLLILGVKNPNYKLIIPFNSSMCLKCSC